MQITINYGGESLPRTVESGTVRDLLTPGVLSSLNAPEVSRLSIVDDNNGNTLELGTQLYDGMELQLDVASCSKA